MASRPELLLAYRHLYQHLLRAVQYAQPARFIARDRLRRAYQTSDAASFDAQRIANTLEFLRGAAKSTGLEHKIVKNLMHVWWSQQRNTNYSRPADLVVRRKAHLEFGEAIKNLNRTMELCIK